MIRGVGGALLALVLVCLTGSPSLNQPPRRVQGLIDNPVQQDTPPTKDPQAALAKLDQVLRDPRFQYPEETPEPTATPEPAQQQQAPAVGSLGGWQFAFLLIAGVIALGVLVYLMRTMRFQRIAPEAGSPETAEDPPTSTAARDLAAESEAVHDYRRAIRYLYLASLLKLDERGLIHYDRTLTNREHLRQVRGNPVVAEALQPVVDMFDRVWYGFAPVDEPHYRDFRADVERLDQLEHLNP